MAYLDTSVARTSWLEFNEIFGPLALYFKAKTTEPVDRQYYKRVSFYPLGALKGAVEKHIDVNRPVPSSFPSPNELATLCADWLQEHPEIRDSLVVYDPEEDLDFPMEKLWTAFDILTKQGTQRFNSYCQSVRMPRQDRERVVCKARAVAARGNDQILKAKLKDMADGILETLPASKN